MAADLPTHAYIPGQTARHPEGGFDDLRASVQSGMTASELQNTSAWRAGLRFYKSGYNWEAHEVWESVWLVLPDGKDRCMVRAMIQLANAALKLRMNRPRATLRLCDIVQAELFGFKDEDSAMGVPVRWIRKEADRVRKKATL